MLTTTLSTGSTAHLSSARSSGSSEFAVVIAADLWSYRPLVGQIMEWISEMRPWTVVCPDYFPSPEGEAGLSGLPDVTDDQAIADLVAAADVSGASRAGLLGFCAGGRMAFLAAPTDRFVGLVSCYGRVTPYEGPGSEGPSDAAAAVARSKTAVLDIVAGRDHHAGPASHIEAFSDHPGVPVVVYPTAEHGFVHDPTRPSTGWPTANLSNVAPFDIELCSKDGRDAWDQIFHFFDRLTQS